MKIGPEEFFIGTDKRPGLIGESLWSIQPLNIEKAMRILFDDIHAWPQAAGVLRTPIPGTDQPGWLTSLLSHPVVQEPSGKVNWNP